MKLFSLILPNLRRRTARTTFTVLSIAVAFTLFGVVMAIRAAFAADISIAGAERLVMLDRVSLINLLPVRYGAQIAATPGVADVTHATWFGGVYQDPRNGFASLAVEAESWLRVYQDLVVPPAQRDAWLANRTGAMVGIETARRFGWTVGDRVPLQGTIYRRPDGRPWEFTIEAIYDGADETVDRTRFLLHHAYLNETLAPGSFGRDQITFFVIKVADPSQAIEVASRVDARFANSPRETRTSTEKAFVSSFANQIGDIGTIMLGTAGAVLFAILLVTGNTMAQAIRERTGEFAVLKTIGFGDGLILSLVLAESCLLALVGGVLGLGLSLAAIAVVGDPTHGMLPRLYLSTDDALRGLAVIVTLGLATGLVPALQARRLRIVDALRRH